MNQSAPEGVAPLAILERRHEQQSLKVPASLYIPPEAMVVVLDSFEGPLDLLLHLIRKHEFDIMDIRIAEITDQYIRYIELMTALKLELAGEYLLMAATLAEIKSRMLLPVLVPGDEEEDDPRTRLMRQLLEYSMFKSAAQQIDALPRAERDIVPISVAAEDPEHKRPLQRVYLRELILSMADLMRQSSLLESHQIAREQISTRDRISFVMDLLAKTMQPVPFERLIDLEEGRAGVVVTMLALMELLKDHMIELSQTQAFGPILVRALSQDARNL